MIDYTARLTALMEDIVGRVPALGFIDMREVLVFARHGRRGAGGALATCHTLDPPGDGPDRFSWVDRRTGRVARQSAWFVVRAPEVRIAGRRVRHLISFALPRFCEQTLGDAGKREHDIDGAPWLAKLDTVVHELYHIDPAARGIRRASRADGTASRRAHGAVFYRQVAGMVRAYLATRPDPALLDFLACDYRELVRRYGVLAGRTFRGYPSFPQPYLEPVDGPPPAPGVGLVRLRTHRQPPRYTEGDLRLRRFMARGRPILIDENRNGSVRPPSIDEGSRPLFRYFNTRRTDTSRGPQ